MSRPVHVQGLQEKSHLLMKKEAWEKFKSIREEKIFLSNGRKVVLSNQGFKKVLSHSANLLILEVIPSLKELLENSVYLFRETDTKNKVNISFFESRATKFEINNTVHYIRFVLRNEKNKSELIHYDHTL